MWWLVGSNPQCGQTNFYLVMVELGFDKMLQKKVTELETSSQKNKNIFPCNECDVETKRKTNLTNHRETTHDQGLSNEKGSNFIDKASETAQPKSDPKSEAFDEAFKKIKEQKLGYPELCHNRLDCFCFVLNLVGVEQN